MTLSASYDPTTAQDLYAIGQARQQYRLWAGEKLLHDLGHIGMWSFFEGPGPDPTVLTGYSTSKIWLKTSAGVQTSQATFWVYIASTATWTQLTPTVFGTWQAESAGAYADQAAASAAAAADYLAMVAILTNIGSNVYDTVAAMNAAASGISANAYALVLRDENYGYQITLYKKVAGVMTFQRIMLARGNVIDVRDFGLTGSGDETADFEVLRQYLVANDGQTVYFPPGVTYKSSCNAWLVGVKNVTINAYGAKFQYLHGSTVITSSAQYCTVQLGSGPITHSQTAGPILGSLISVSDGYNPASGITVTSGYLINTAAAGATSITTSTASEAGNIEAGDNLLIHSFSRVAGSYPPNAKYFEYAVAAAAGNSGTGVVALDKPLSFGHKATAPDDTYNTVVCGKARVINLDRSDYTIARRIVWNGGEFLVSGITSGFIPTPGYDGSIAIDGVLECEVNDLICAGAFPTMCKNVVFNRCEFYDLSEPDKLIDSLTYNDCRMTDITQGTGVMRTRINRGSIQGNFAEIVSREIYLDGVEIHSQSSGADPKCQIGGSNFHTTLWSAENCTFFPNASQLGGVIPGNIYQFTPDAVTTTTMVINSGNAAMASLKEKVDIGQRITINGTSGVFDVFVITDISFDGSNNLTLTGYHNVASPRAASDLRVLWPTQRAIIKNPRVINPPSGWQPSIAIRRAWCQAESGDLPGVVSYVRRLRNPIPADLTGWTVNGRVLEVAVTVHKAYSGTGTAQLRLARNNGPGTAWGATVVNLAVAGRRVISTASPTGTQSGDTLPTITAGTYMETFYIDFYNGATSVLDQTTEDVLPIVDMEIRVASI